MTSPLQEYLGKLIETKAPKAVAEFAMILRSKHKNVLAILAYGSALRESNPAETLIDFYVLTQSLDGVSMRALSRVLCARIPPNVYYLEHEIDSQVYRAKYAVMPMELLAQKVSGFVANPYFWARFCQPVTLVFSANHEVKKRTVQILESAANTASCHAAALAPMSSTREQWAALFRETYKTELRPEDATRANLIVSSQIDHFETLSRLSNVSQISTVSWQTRRWQGKLLSIGRLAKAAFTFQGGADYAAWKISRHSGVKIEIKDWHRKHPLLASIVFLPKLLRKGGLK